MSQTGSLIKRRFLFRPIWPSVIGGNKNESHWSSNSIRDTVRSPLTHPCLLVAEVTQATRRRRRPILLCISMASEGRQADRN